MSTIPDEILTNEHYANIKNALDNISKAQKHIDQAVLAGFDMTQQQAQLNDAKQKLLQIKQVYFPNKL